MIPRPPITTPTYARLPSTTLLRSSAAFFTVVAVLVFGAAVRAHALDEAVGQEHVLFRVEILVDRTGGDVPSVTQLQVDLARQLTVCFGVSGEIGRAHV